MYRNPTSIAGNNIVASGRFPSPSKNSDDSDSETPVLLNQKRRELDQEVAQFKEAKDREFHDFEKSIRKQRPKRKRESKARKESSNSAEVGSKPGALSLLAGLSKNGNVNGNCTPLAKGSDTPEIQKQPKIAPLSKPTISLDRKNIRGETTPTYGSPLPAEKLTRQLSKSPENGSLACTPPKLRSPILANPPTPMRESHDLFAGVFTPSFLPLLESADSKGAVHAQRPDNKLQRHNSFSHSQSSSELLSPTSRSQRAQTAPTLPSTSLPSALRTASGTTVRTQKHVTFQLADSAIVEPSSSYEEMPSPDPREESKELTNGILEKIVSNGKAETDKEIDQHVVASFPPQFGQKPLRSPTIHGKAQSVSKLSVNDDDLSPMSAEENLGQADDGGSGVGFFELDEEIASPRFGDVRPFEMDEMDDGVDQDDRGDKPGRRDIGSQRDIYRPSSTSTAYEYSGSVPIDIVKPTGSWVGSFGH